MTLLEAIQKTTLSPARVTFQTWDKDYYWDVIAHNGIYAIGFDIRGLPQSQLITHEGWRPYEEEKSLRKQLEEAKEEIAKLLAETKKANA